MNVLSKLSIKNLRMNKKRTISTIVGIILSVALICGVATIATSFRETLIQNAINKSGNWHIKLEGVKEKDEKVLEKNIDIENIYKVKNVGYSKLDGIKNVDKPYLNVFSMDKNSFTNLKFKLEEGRFPENNNEIVIPKHLEYNGGVKLKVGDTVKLAIGKRVTLDNFKLYPSNPYNEEDEKLENTNLYEFKIVGVLERPSYDFEPISNPGYTAITTNLNKGDLEEFILLKNPNEYKESVTEILGAKNFKEVESNSGKFKFENFKFNNELIRWQTFNFEPSSLNAIITLCSILIFVIIFTSVFCIRNSFAIATTEKIKMYGMLASVGTTKKQIRKNVIFEALILGAIGIPFGILGGLLGIYLLLKVVNILVGDFLLDGTLFAFKASLIGMIISAVLGFITVYLSAISSARKASKVSPIESLKNSNEIKLKSKKLKTPKIIEKLFGAGGVIAYKNLKRSKKKYRTTVISLTVSIFVFITMSSFVKNMFNISSRYYKNLDYNIEINNVSNKMTNKEFNKILNLGNIKDKHILYHMPQTSSIVISDTSKFIKKFDIEYNELGKEQKRKIEEMYLNVVGLDKNTYNNYLKKLGINEKNAKNKAVLYDIALEYDEKEKTEKEYRAYNYNKKDKIIGKLQHNKKDFEIEILDVANKGPIGFEKCYSNAGYLFVNVEDFSNLEFSVDKILINSDDPNTFESNFKKEFNTHEFRLENIYKYVQQEKAISIVISIFLYGFITIITLIGVTNIFNTITSNIELRQKEFAMLKSIGMTKKEFNKMVNLETIFYSTKSLIYGIILGLIGTFALYKAASIKIEAGIYIPVVPIVISVIAVFILVFVIMKYSINKINKQNTIETIRKDNI